MIFLIVKLKHQNQIMNHVQHSYTKYAFYYKYCQQLLSQMMQTIDHIIDNVLDKNQSCI